MGDWKNSPAVIAARDESAAQWGSFVLLLRRLDLTDDQRKAIFDHVTAYAHARTRYTTVLADALEEFVKAKAG